MNEQWQLSTKLLEDAYTEGVRNNETHMARREMTRKDSADPQIEWTIFTKKLKALLKAAMFPFYIKIDLMWPEQTDAIELQLQAAHFKVTRDVKRYGGLYYLAGYYIDIA